MNPLCASNSFWGDSDWSCLYKECSSNCEERRNAAEERGGLIHLLFPKTMQRISTINSTGTRENPRLWRRTGVCRASSSGSHRHKHKQTHTLSLSVFFLSQDRHPNSLLSSFSFTFAGTHLPSSTPKRKDRDAPYSRQQRPRSAHSRCHFSFLLCEIAKVTTRLRSGNARGPKSASARSLGHFNSKRLLCWCPHLRGRPLG